MWWIPLAIAGAQRVAQRIGQHEQRQADRQNRAAQQEFATHGIRWRVEDAKAAGLHPLAALGTSGASFSPSYQVGGGDVDLGSMSQDITRAIEATKTRSEKDEAGMLRLLQAIESRDAARDEAGYRAAEHDMRMQVLASQLARTRQEARVTAPMPEVAPIGGVQHKADEVTSRAPGDPSRTAGTHAGWIRVESAPGRYVMVPNPALNVDSELMHTWVAAQMVLDRALGPKVGELNSRDYAGSRRVFGTRGGRYYGPWTPHRKGL